MRIDRDSLRDLFQGYANSRRPPCRRDCPAFTAIAGSFEPSASNRNKKKIVDHISECSYCREEFMLLFELQKAESDPVGERDTNPRGDPRQGKAKGRGPGYPLLWRYACVLIGFGLALTSFFILVQNDEISEVQRTPRTGILMLSPEIDQAISGPLVFRWLGNPDAEYYILELFDEALLPVWTSDKIRDIQVDLPSEIDLKLRPRRSYFWMITAYSQDSRMNESKLVRFTIVR